MFVRPYGTFPEIHPAIIEALSRKNFGFAHQTKMFNIFDRKTDRRTKKKTCKSRDPKKYILKI